MTSKHIFVDGVECKYCSKCGELKPLAEFTIDSRRKDRRSSRCRACNLSACMEYYKKNAEKLRECHREYFRKRYAEDTVFREVTLAGCRDYWKRVREPNNRDTGQRGAIFEEFVCEVCGKPFRRLKSKVDWQYEHKGHLPRFCSHECLCESMRKSYKTPYAKNIERIKKEVKV